MCETNFVSTEAKFNFKKHDFLEGISILSSWLSVKVKDLFAQIKVDFGEKYISEKVKVV